MLLYGKVVHYGRSGSSKLVPIDFLLVFHCNYMPIFYRFRDITSCWSNTYVFRRFYPTQSRKRCSWYIWYKSWYQKTEVYVLPDGGPWKPRDPAVIGFESSTAWYGRPIVVFNVPLDTL